MSSQEYTVLVNSSDGFEDCWRPFFLLYKKYWPQADAPIFLNTEKKTWRYPGLDIHCTRVQGDFSRRLTWSECLIAALNKITTPLVLYFQEDYFIHQPVRHDLVTASSEYMINHPEVKHIALTRHGSMAPYEAYKESWLYKIRQDARYRISTQAGLWRVETLKSYLRAEENGWMFEIFGTWRAHRQYEWFLVANFEPKSGGPAIDYLHTGIVKGQWLQAIQGIFDTNGIEVDYVKRGFYRPKHPLIHKFDVGRKLLERPGYFIKQFFSHVWSFVFICNLVHNVIAPNSRNK